MPCASGPTHSCRISARPGPTYHSACADSSPRGTRPPWNLKRRCYRADDADACLLDRLPHATCEAAALAFLVPVPGAPIPGPGMDVHELRLSPAARHGADGAAAG